MLSGRDSSHHHFCFNLLTVGIMSRKLATHTRLDTWPILAKILPAIISLSQPVYTEKSCSYRDWHLTPPWQGSSPSSSSSSCRRRGCAWRRSTCSRLSSRDQQRLTHRECEEVSSVIQDEGLMADEADIHALSPAFLWPSKANTQSFCSSLQPPAEEEAGL